MRKIVVSEFITLDGVIEAPDQWSFNFWSEESAKFKLDELKAGDALLLGRVTYQGFAAAWPSMTDDDGFADRMNGLPKHVVSTTLDEVEWNNSRLIKENIAATVTELKQQPGQDILVFGSGQLVQSLMEHNLVDEFRLMMFPVVLGSGKRLFQETGRTALKRTHMRTFGSGVVVLTYQPARNE